MKRVVLISGHLGTGKSGLAQSLHAEFGFHVVKTSDMLRGIAEKEGGCTDRISLQRLGDQMDVESNGEWLYNEVISIISGLPADAQIVVDNVRTRKQVAAFRRASDLIPVHVHLYILDKAVLKHRWDTRVAQGKAEHIDYPEADLVKDEEDIRHFKEEADIRIETSRSDPGDTVVRVAARLGLYSPPDLRCVDVIVGGQYGSEGKGNIAAYLAPEYDVLVRVGGPNAGHTVAARAGEYVYHQLPSGCRDTSARILLGPGMTIDVEKLMAEVADCGITVERLFIDPQAMIIQPEDKDAEQEMRSAIGSTAQGGGAAAARRIMGRVPGKVILARDVDVLRPYVGADSPYRGSTMARLEDAYRRGQSILLEGTQGSGLSLFHGDYPHVTSRDTNVAGCLAEAGISPSRVRRILVVIRSAPIRVGNPEGGESGPMKHETDLQQISSESGLNLAELEKREVTSTTHRKRRIGLFDWEQFRKTCALNAPTDVVLTFADYLDAKNQHARRFEQLEKDTIMFIEELENVAHAHVSLISTRFPSDSERNLDLRNIIDRRNWSGSSN